MDAKIQNKISAAESLNAMATLALNVGNIEEATKYMIQHYDVIKIAYLEAPAEVTKRKLYVALESIVWFFMRQDEVDVAWPYAMECYTVLEDIFVDDVSLDNAFSLIDAAFCIFGCVVNSKNTNEGAERLGIALKTCEKVVGIAELIKSNYADHERAAHALGRYELMELYYKR